MKVKEILKKKKKKLVTIDKKSTIQEAIILMNEHRIGALMVVDKDEKLVGLISERDILRKFESCDTMINVLVEKIMTREIITGKPGDTVPCLMGVMADKKIRHLPILEGENLVGIVSILDLVRFQMENLEYRNECLQKYIES